MYVIDIWAKEGRGGFVLKRAVFTSPSNFPAIFLNGVQINQNEKCFICFMIKWKPYIAFLITLKRFGRLVPLVKRTKEELYIWYHDLSHSMFFSLMILLNSKVGLYKDDCLKRVNSLLWKRQSCFWPGALVSMKRWNMLNVRQLDIWWLVAQPEVKIYFQCWCNNMFFMRSQLHTEEKIAFLVFSNQFERRAWICEILKVFYQETIASIETISQPWKLW